MFAFHFFIFLLNKPPGDVAWKKICWYRCLQKLEVCAKRFKQIKVKALENLKKKKHYLYTQILWFFFTYFTKYVGLDNHMNGNRKKNVVQNLLKWGVAYPYMYVYIMLKFKTVSLIEWEIGHPLNQINLPCNTVSLK